MAQRHLSLLAFNDIAVQQNAYARNINPDTYDYFEYVERERYSQFDYVLDLATRPLYQTAMGAPVYLQNILGLSLFDLLDLDLKTLNKIEKVIDKLSEVMNKEPPKGNPEEP